VDPLTAPAADWGVAVMAREGESVSGDRFLVHENPEDLLIAAIDGVGHGPEAAAAAEAAIHVLEEEPSQPIAVLLDRCHRALQGTRGAVMLLARYDVRKSRLDWAGIGPILGAVTRADHNRRPRIELLLTRKGVVGLASPSASTASIAIDPGDLLVLASDGVRQNFVDALRPTDVPARLARTILDAHRKSDDDALVLAVRFRSPAA
jgi:serine phosphatase RsbU (regulator of sigma subunit)